MLGAVVVFLGSGFSGCMSFSINEQEAVEQSLPVISIRQFLSQ